MVLKEGVKFFWGTSGSNIVKVMNQVADKYKVIAANCIALSDDLQDAQNFSPYAFMTYSQTSQVGRAFAYFYGKMRKKEKKFYILNQDYMFGHDLGEGFKKGLKEYYPEAQIVRRGLSQAVPDRLCPLSDQDQGLRGRGDFHRRLGPGCHQPDQAGQGHGDQPPFCPDLHNQSKSLDPTRGRGHQGFDAGLALYNSHSLLQEPGPKSSIHKIWKAAYDRFKPPYNDLLYSQGWVPLSMEIYWLLSVIERAGSVDPEKIIKVWEGDSYEYVNGQVVTMRACDHTLITDFTIVEYVPPAQQKVSFNIPPYYWTDKTSWFGQSWVVPADKVLPWMDPKLERCKGKNPGSAK